MPPSVLRPGVAVVCVALSDISVGLDLCRWLCFAATQGVCSGVVLAFLVFLVSGVSGVYWCCFGWAGVSGACGVFGVSGLW